MQTRRTFIQTLAETIGWRLERWVDRDSQEPTRWRLHAPSDAFYSCGSLSEVEALLNEAIAAAWNAHRACTVLHTILSDATHPRHQEVATWLSNPEYDSYMWTLVRDDVRHDFHPPARWPPDLLKQLHVESDEMPELYPTLLRYMSTLSAEGLLQALPVPKATSSERRSRL